MEERFLKALLFLFATGVLNKAHLRYVEPCIREKVMTDRDAKVRATICKEIFEQIVETYIWKDRRFVKV